MPYRETSVAQANEPEPDRRAAIDAARNEALDEQLNPLLLELFERGRPLARELGWPSTLVMSEELSGIDLRALGRQTAALIEATEDTYEPLVGPRLEEQLGFGFDRLRRADLSAFFRAPSLDRCFPGERLVGSLVDTLAGLGIDVESQVGVTLDTEARPKKSPRAFCAPVRVPDEVYLVIARIGGRDDYAALFHEAGHIEHYAHMEASLPVEDRYLGDNSITEGFAFLFEHLTDDPRLARADPGRGRSRRGRPPRGGGQARSSAATAPSSPTSSSCTTPIRRWASCRPATPSCSARPSTSTGRAPRLADVDLFFGRPLPPRLGARDAPAAGAERASGRPGSPRRRPGASLAAYGAPASGTTPTSPGGAQRRTARSDGVGLARELLLDRVEDRLAVGVATLVVAHLRSCAGVRSVRRVCTWAAVRSS